MADHPLRSATRRRLGRPLPHQQADRPRAHPQPQKLSTNPHAGESEYPVLDPVSQAYPKVRGRSPTCYSPVRHSSTPEGAFPFDLHVLSTPPAFVLSQDQTLHEKTLKPKFQHNLSQRDKKNLTKKQSKKLAKKQTHKHHPTTRRAASQIRFASYHSKNGIKQSTNTLSSSQRTHTHPNYSQRKQPR